MQWPISWADSLSLEMEY